MNIKILFRSIYELVKSSPKLTVLLLFITSVSGFFPLVSIYSVSMIVYCLTQNEFSSLVLYSLIWVLSLSVPGLIGNLTLLIQSALSENMFLYLTRKLSDSINNIKYINIFENEKIHKDIDILKNNISNRPVNFVVTIGSILTSFIKVVSISISILYFSIYLPILSFLLGIIIFYLSSKSQKELWSGSLSRNFQSRMMSYIFSLNVDRAAMQEIRIYNFRNFLNKKFYLMYKETKEIMHKIRLRVGILSIFAGISVVTISALMILNVFYLISIGIIGVSSLIFLLQGIQSIQVYTRSASEQLGWLGGHLLFFEKYIEYTDAYYNINEIDDVPVLNRERIKSLELKNCTFKYGESIILNNINLKINENDIVAVVGKNGAGKTTLVRILMGLLKPTEGEVLINGRELSDYGLQNYWHKCAYVPQLFAQFKFTLNEAIYLGRYPDNHKIVDDPLFEEGMPDRNQQLGKEFSGTDLSGGQWQKLAIMRSLINQEETDLLFFDEPTSAIDPIIEDKIYTLIEEISSGKITIFITHRMSTVTHANRIILLDEKVVSADGSHEKLYKNNELYRKMFDSQAGRFNVNKSQKTCVV